MLVVGEAATARLRQRLRGRRALPALPLPALARICRLGALRRSTAERGQARGSQSREGPGRGGRGE